MHLHNLGLFSQNTNANIHHTGAQAQVKQWAKSCQGMLPVIITKENTSEPKAKKLNEGLMRKKEKLVRRFSSYGMMDFDSNDVVFKRWAEIEEADEEAHVQWASLKRPEVCLCASS